MVFGFLKLKKSEKETFILVKEDDRGIVTFMNKEIMNFNASYKKQLVSFLKSVVDQLEKSISNNQKNIKKK